MKWTMLILTLVVLVALPIRVQATSSISVSTTPVAELDAFIPDLLGGDATAMDPNTNTPLLDQGLEYDDAILMTPPIFSSARRLAMDSIPNTLDWAIWDPSGRGDDHPERVHVQGRVTTTGGPLGDGGPLGNYHAGEQVEWISKFSDPAEWGVDSADGLGADFFLDTGTAVPRSSNSDFRASDTSGKLALRLDDADYTLNATLPDGLFDVHLFVRDSDGDASGTATLDGAQASLGAMTGVARNNGYYTLHVNNDSGSPQDLNVVLGGGNLRFAGVVVQIVPEPSSVMLLLGGLALLGSRRSRR